MDTPPEVSCFVPAYNEERLIAHNLRILDGVLTRATRSHEIIAVDDGSTDATVAEVASLGSERIGVMPFADGPSFRENLGRAMATGRGDLVMFADADLATDLRSVGVVLDRVRSGADIAVGSRYLRKSKATRTLGRKALSLVYNRYLQVVFRSPIRDHQCGLKVFRREVLRCLLTSMYDRDRSERAWFWDAELLLRAQWAGYRVDEVPVEWVCRADSRFMLHRQLRILPYSLRLMLEELLVRRGGRRENRPKVP